MISRVRGGDRHSCIQDFLPRGGGANSFTTCDKTQISSRRGKGLGGGGGELPLPLYTCTCTRSPANKDSPGNFCR